MVVSEIRRIFFQPTFWVFVGVTLVLSALVTMLSSSFIDPRYIDPEDYLMNMVMQSAVGSIIIFPFIYGLISVTRDFTSGFISRLVLFCGPVRLIVFKAVAGLVALGFFVAATLLPIFVIYPIYLAGEKMSLHLDFWEFFSFTLHGVAGITLIYYLGVAAAWLIRKTLWGVLGWLAVSQVLPILFIIAEGGYNYARLLPGSSLMNGSLLHLPRTINREGNLPDGIDIAQIHYLHPDMAVLVLMAWVVVVGAAGVVRTLLKRFP